MRNLPIFELFCNCVKYILHYYVFLTYSYYMLCQEYFSINIYHKLYILTQIKEIPY